jgi:hypothetical protein
MKYLRPLIDTKAGTSLDVDRFLNTAMREYPNKDIYLLGQDQAMESATWELILKRPLIFGRWVTIACMLHINMWLLCGIWQLCRNTVLYGFVCELGASCTVACGHD